MELFDYSQERLKELFLGAPRVFQKHYIRGNVNVSYTHMIVDHDRVPTVISITYYHSEDRYVIFKIEVRGMTCQELLCELDRLSGN